MAIKKKGSAYIETLFSFIAITAIVLTFVSLWQPFMVKQSVDNVARLLTKAVEVSGEINSDVDDLKTELINNLPSDVRSTATVIYDAPFLAGTQKIQIADTFKVTVRCETKVKIFEPTFGDPVTVTVPISKTFQGISQVYHK